MSIRPALAGRLLACAALAISVALLAPADRAQPAPGALISQGKSPDLFLLYTGDVIGYLDPCG